MSVVFSLPRSPEELLKIYNLYFLSDEATLWFFFSLCLILSISLSCHRCGMNTFIIAFYCYCHFVVVVVTAGSSCYIPSYCWCWKLFRFFFEPTMVLLLVVVAWLFEQRWQIYQFILSPVDGKPFSFLLKS
jgi:hypothetical protein